MSTGVNKIITKPPNRGFQLRKPFKTTVEQERALRDQLHIEIENKTKACSNPTFECSIPRIEGYEYCLRHILLDPRAPYKQCAYIYSLNGKKCSQAAQKHDGKKEPGLTNLCFEHSRLAQLNKTRNSIGKYKQVESNEAYLNDLVHHIKVDKKSGIQKFQPDADEEIDVVTPNVDPFIDIDEIDKQDSNKRRILDYASDSSSDQDSNVLNNTWQGHECSFSDNESVDSQNDDLLKHAGIYTTEEATMITKQKMTRLQVLYMEQVLRLQHLLKEKRRKYLQAIRKERETLCSIHDQYKDTPQERRLYEKLKALNHYQKKHGSEAILHRKFQDKRAKISEGASHRIPVFSKCIFTEGGVKCGDRSLPCCKYCRKHILEDKKQILFRACGVEKSAIVCQEPVPNIFDDSTCVLHIKFPAQKQYTLKKYESETDDDDEDIKREIKDEPVDEEIIMEQENDKSNEFPDMMHTVDNIGDNITIAHDDDEQPQQQQQQQQPQPQNHQNPQSDPHEEIIEETIVQRNENNPDGSEILFEITTGDIFEEPA